MLSFSVNNNKQYKYTSYHIHRLEMTSAHSISDIDVEITTYLKLLRDRNRDFAYPNFRFSVRFSSKHFCLDKNIRHKQCQLGKEVSHEMQKKGTATALGPQPTEWIAGYSSGNQTNSHFVLSYILCWCRHCATYNKMKIQWKSHCPQL